MGKKAKAGNLLNRGGKWVYRVFYRINGVKKEKQIPLRTPSLVTARERSVLILKVLRDIKLNLIDSNGKEYGFNFPWLSESNIIKVKRFTLKDAVDQWMSKRVGKLAEKTIELNQDGLNYFLKFIGSIHPLESITTNRVEQFADWLDEKGLSKTSINIHLRTIKAMFRYYLKVDRLVKIPHIEQLRIPKTEPIYITDNEFQSIMELDWLDDFYKRVFLLYRETGMRLNEPMISVLDGDWIDIPNTSKGKVGRNIQLDRPMQSIFNELNEWLSSGYGSRLKTPDDHISKMFKKALRCIGADEGKHFHSLRHTFAVRRLIQGTSIYELKLLMGHSSVTTTEVYSNMNLKRVSQDFPTIVSMYLNEIKIGKKDTLLKDTVALPVTYVT